MQADHLLGLTLLLGELRAQVERQADEITTLRAEVSRLTQAADAAAAAKPAKRTR